MSAQGQVMDFLRAAAPVEKGIIPLTPNQIAIQTGVSREQVNKTLYNLSSHNRVDLVRGSNGRDIIGLKPIDLEPRQRGGRRVKGDGTERIRYARPVAIDGTRRGISLRTPALDEYARSKSRFDSLKADLGELVEATFRENPYAEEGLRLRERLASIEQQFIEVRREKDEAERDLRGIRGRKRAEMADEAMRNGTLAQPGD